MSILLKNTKNIMALFICSTFTASNADTYNNSHQAELTISKRIEVYSLSQNYWDTQYGDTLDEIVIQLLPNNPSKREVLKLDIVELNSEAFINNNPALLLANKRLWMPGYMKQADSKVDPATTIVERYSWGNIKRPKDNNPQMVVPTHGCVGTTICGKNHNKPRSANETTSSPTTK